MEEFSVSHTWCFHAFISIFFSSSPDAKENTVFLKLSFLIDTVVFCTLRVLVRIHSVGRGSLRNQSCFLTECPLCYIRPAAAVSQKRHVVGPSLASTLTGSHTRLFIFGLWPSPYNNPVFASFSLAGKRKTFIHDRHKIPRGSSWLPLWFSEDCRIEGFKV